MKCKKCRRSYPIYKYDLCKECFKESCFFCKECEKKLEFNYVEIKDYYMCPTCLIKYLNIKEIFKDGIVNEHINEEIKKIYADYKYYIYMFIFFLIFSTCLFGYALITKDVDDYFALIIAGSIFITTIYFLKMLGQKKSLSHKMNNIEELLIYVLLSNKFNEYEIPAKFYITEIIHFVRYVIENYNGDINKISETDIAYLANEKEISVNIAKNYIEYYKRISKEFNNISKKIIYQQNYEEELEEYYESLEKYNGIVNYNKYTEYNDNYDEITTCLSNRLSANNYYNQMHIKKEKIEILKYKNIKLTLKIKMPEIIILNKPIAIKGMIKVNLFEKDELIAEGYIHGEFKNNNEYKITCKAIKDIKNLEKIEIKYEPVELWLP